VALRTDLLEVLRHLLHDGLQLPDLQLRLLSEQQQLLPEIAASEVRGQRREEHPSAG